MNKILSTLDVTTVIVISLAVGFILWTSYFVFKENHVHLYAENSLIENAQVYLLAIASVIYLSAVIFKQRSDHLIMLFCSLLCGGFFLRELDVEHLDVPHVLILVGSGVGRNIILAAGFIAIFVFAALNFSYYKRASSEFVKSKPGWLIITGGVFILLGQVFEESKGVFPHHVFLEEISELFAYVLILLSSLAARAAALRSRIRTGLPRGETYGAD